MSLAYGTLFCFSFPIGVILGELKWILSEIQNLEFFFFGTAVVLLDSEYIILLLGKSFDSVFDIDYCGRTRLRIDVIPFLLILFVQAIESLPRMSCSLSLRNCLLKSKKDVHYKTIFRAMLPLTMFRINDHEAFPF